MENMVEHKFNEKVEGQLSQQLWDEFTTSKNNYQVENDEFDKMIDMMECVRSDKDYDWMSDIFLPEFPSIMLAEGSEWANQYFQTRDFVEVKLEGDNPENKLKSRAIKKLLNETLNRKGLCHFAKYIRARTINALVGRVYAVCYWKQKTRKKIVGQETVPVPMDIDIYGRPMEDPESQVPVMREEIRDIEGEVVVYDHFDYDVVDPRNVFTDNSYVYSLQDKRFIIIRAERYHEQLVEEAEQNGYFNLDLVKEMMKGDKPETDTSRETYNKDDVYQRPSKSPIKLFDILTRMGKMFASVTDRDEYGYPVSVEPGYDDLGNLKEDAELIEGIMTLAVSGTQKILIRFQPQPNRNHIGEPYRPIIRGWCYIHPTKDSGLSDGKNMKENQKAINDTMNMSADRTKLATLPTLQGRKYALEDNTTLFFAPQHIMEVEEPGKDLVEFKISDDVSGALQQIQMLKDGMHQVTARFPTTMGALPSAASTTATAVAGSEVRTSSRSNYKSLTFEHTFLNEFYWQIIQMANQYARMETMQKMMGDDLMNFDPDQDYNYSPLSSNIEMEYNKYRKLNVIDQMLGRVVNFPNPKTPMLLNYLLKQAFELFGNEFPEYKDILLDESPQAQQMAMMQGQGDQMADQNMMPTSNQSGLMQSGQEQMARGAIQ